ncbi:sulfur oxidation c-type cytochrome SoxX [Maritalea porphyrae]|jgi:sulfur-oxidizing protein SoxX|uniref:sulfur oxidation c-type cytochrome SoxX n=1 Tax=Maritalea porphyrae TaxID=880732 RepID=UPI0022AF68CB|nr:sulfur oxidation c-type cytochrome SoxX [Maritalea porphyrae]MCZ4271227.1 sulfur oxidation c-type cytochrome SoxX [Maritalea porphyrae]
MRKLIVAATAAILCSTAIALADTVGPNEVKIVDAAVEGSLSGQAGDAAAGRDIMINRKLGNCLACHQNSEIPEQPFHGEVGPPLDGVADRWSEGELRAILVDVKTAMNPDSIMPSFYSLNLGVRVAESFAGKTILQAQQVEDVLAYLMTLKEE